MASSFLREDPVLFFGPRAPVEYSQRRFLLWPMWAYRVVAPAVRQRQLNVLQKAVLGMSRAGVVTAEAVSQKLHLHPDLAAFIASELQARSWLDHRGMPTDKGLQILEEETLESQRTVTGFVFQDPWTSDLWPRFIERLEYVETEPGPDRFPMLLLGSTGQRRPQRTYMHLPRDFVSVSPPDAVDILDATRRHRRALRHSTPLLGGEDEDGSVFEPNPVDLDRVSLIDERPQRVFLTTYVYLPKETASAGDWQVCDPFGLGVSPSLRRSIERQMEHSPQLRSRVEELLGSALSQGVEDIRAWMERLRGKAELAVETRLSSGVHHLPYHTHLLEMELAHLEVEELGASSAVAKLRTVLLAARRVIEALFAHLLEAHQPPNITRRLASDPEHTRSVYTATARELGLEIPIPRALGNVKRHQIEDVVKYRDAWRLRPLIVANLLAARDEARHPLRQAARHEKRLLNELDTIAGTAGKQLHHGAEALQAKVVQDTVNRVYRVVGLLSGLDDGTRNPPLR